MRRWMTLLGLMVAVASAQAAEPAPPLFELTPFVGFGLGGRFSQAGTGGTGVGTAGGTGTTVDLADHAAFAVAMDLHVDEGTAYELFYSRESSDLQGNSPLPRMKITVEYLHIGGMTLFDEEALLKPYMVGGVGLTRLSPGEQQGTSDTRFSASLGLGFRWPVNRHFSVRFEARGFVTLVNPDTAIFCRSDQTGLLCRVRGRGQTFFQGQVLAGAAYAF